MVACNDFNQDGVPDRSRRPLRRSRRSGRSRVDESVGRGRGPCTVNDRLSFAPDWSATLQAEYTFPITASMDIFGRGLYSYYTTT